MHDSWPARQPVSVWIVEDNANYRQAIQALINDELDLTCPHAFPDGESLFETLNSMELGPHLILMDIGLPGMDGIEATRRVRGICPRTEVIMLTIHEDPERIFEAIRSGACGYVVKEDSTDVIAAIRTVIGGGAPMAPRTARQVLDIFAQLHAPRWDYQLTDREKEVLKELTRGGSKKAIAKRLFLSVHTVDTHIRNIYAKLHVHSRGEVVAKALKERIVDA